MCFFKKKGDKVIQIAEKKAGNEIVNGQYIETTYVVWEEDITNAAINCRVSFNPGMNAYYVVDGFPKDLFMDEKKIIKSKKDVKSKANLKLVCVNSDKRYSAPYGVGNIAYQDLRTKVKTSISAYGDCDYKISNAMNLWNEFGKRNVTDYEVNQKVTEKINEIVRNQLEKFASDNDVEDIKANKNEISECVVNDAKKYFGKMGIIVIACSITEVNTSDDFDERIEEFDKDKEAKRQAKREERENRRKEEEDFDRYKEIIKIAGNANSNANCAPVVTPENFNNGPMKYCKNCKKSLPSDFLFCPDCRAEL